MLQNGNGDDTVVLILEELSVGRAFARGFESVAIVDEKKYVFHNELVLRD